MNPNLFILGKDGYLGSFLFNSFEISKKFNIEGSARSSEIRFDLTDTTIPDEIFTYFKKSPPLYIILTAAIADIEKCAKDPTETRKVNVIGTKLILDLAKSFGTVPVFFSTDYVLKPSANLQLLNEEDECLPLTEYGKQKKEIEDWITINFKRYLIFRTSKLMSMNFHPKNILTQITLPLRTGKDINAFEDQWITPVFIEDIAQILCHQKLENLSGTYHLATKTSYTRYELAHLIKGRLGLKNESKIFPSSLKDFQTTEKRPCFNTLDSTKISSALDFVFTEIVYFEGLKNL